MKYLFSFFFYEKSVGGQRENEQGVIKLYNIQYQFKPIINQSTYYYQTNCCYRYCVRVE